MKLKTLLLLLLFAGILQAQQIVCDYPEGVNTSLVITETRMTIDNDCYIEFTNMSNQPIRLSEFKYSILTPYSNTPPIYDLCNDPWYNTGPWYIFLPDRMLDPGESFVMANAYDYNPIHYKENLGRLGGSERPKQVGIYEVADKLIHREEPILGVYYERDSVTTVYNDPEQLTKRGDFTNVLTSDEGRVFYIEHHFTDGDSAVVDQVGGVFDDNGKNGGNVSYDIAGVQGGVITSILVRKSIIKNGSIDFANGRGIALDDSEWIAIQLPEGYDTWRDVFWTVGNHGNFIIDENTLEPTTDAITVDYAGKKITVPWGIYRLDDIMRHMKKKPGLAWQYDLNPLKEDSLFRSARNGDKLTLFAVGNTLTSVVFDIEVKAPATDDNMVVPVDHANTRVPGITGPLTSRAQNGILSWPRVTCYDHGTDTITGSGFGLAFDLRSDSLLKYLEKPANATWEFVWVDGQKRSDLKNGDILKVTSENGKTKEYFIQVQTYRPSTNADLASITWPDIPEYYRGIFGWKGDTIPNFNQGNTNYRITVPLDVDGIPGLVAKTSNVNATVKVTRAKSLTGKTEDRTIIFKVTAEDDTIYKSYQVELIKEKTPDKIEPFHAEPFISEFINSYPPDDPFVEIYNPGNQPIDLRNYMMGYINLGITDDYWAVTYSPSNWTYRYACYIPGLKHVEQDMWSIYRKFMLPDPNVNSILMGGETFVMAKISRGDDRYPGISAYFPDWDVQFYNDVTVPISNPWNEEVRAIYPPFPPHGNRTNGMALYKILNDSIKRGLKAIKDPADFEVIDIWAMPNGKSWVVGGYALGTNETGNIFIRKPEITKGNPVRGASFGTNEEDCEWIRIQPNVEYSHIPQPERFGAAWSNLKQHNMIEPSYYKSTVNSSIYKVSDGYGPNEKIMGLKTGITVAEFLATIIKQDENQSLKVISVTDGSELGMDATINKNDKLVVVSADQKNTTIYHLDVTETGLNSDAYLTSSRWTIHVSTAPKSAGQMAAEDGMGSISGFDYGTTIKTIVENVNVPAGAMLTVIDGNGSYVPYTTLNFDTTYVSVTVNPDIYLDVVAEDYVTRIVYQLQPNTSENDAFILSDVYEVSQIDNLIHFVPRGTNFDTFLANIIPSLGASLKLVDKMGFERKQGNIREDDKVIVTSANGQNTRIYFIAFLATSTIPQTTYLAYVLSEAYTIDQVNYIISAGLAPLTSETMLDEFIGYIIPSMGATVTVTDKNGQVKSTGDLNDGDKLQVTSADGKIVTTYTLALDLTGAGPAAMQKQIEIYPIPANDRLNILGIDAGNRIQIFNAKGSLIREVKAQSNLESISLEGIPSGIFMIVISDNHQLIGRFKAIRK